MTVAMRRYLSRYLFALILMVLPGLLYWETLSERFGFRDDYSNIREAHEEPGKVIAFCTGMGRPLHGLLLEMTFKHLDGIDGLRYARLAAVLSIGVLCAAMALILELRQGWPRWPAGICALLLGILPSAQVVVNWAICWPHALAAALGVLAFASCDSGMRTESAVRRVGFLAGGSLLLLAGLLIYQPNALLYAVPLASGFLSPSWTSDGKRLRWLMSHALLVCMNLLFAFIVVKALFALGVAPASKRVVVESDLLGKVQWFFSEPLDNALALFRVEDKGNLGGGAGHFLTALCVGSLLIGGAVHEWISRGRKAAGVWCLGAVVLMGLAYAVGLVVAERWASYRTLYAMTGVVLVFVVRTLWSLAETRNWPTRLVGQGGMILLLGLGIVNAAHSNDDLFIEPQRRELERVEEIAEHIDPQHGPRVFVVLPSEADSMGELRYLDEFGSLSSDCEWCTKEMLMLVLKERFPEHPDLAKKVRFAFGPTLPKNPKNYDTVVDLRVPPEVRTETQTEAQPSTPRP